MATYRIYLEGYVEFDTPRTPAQIRNALVTTNPNLRESVKTVFRDMMARDGTGQTSVTEWVLHVDNVRPIEDAADIDLDAGATEETEP